jgi:hypothetical protein
MCVCVCVYVCVRGLCGVSRCGCGCVMYLAILEDMAHAACLFTKAVKSSITAPSCIWRARAERACSPLLRQSKGRIQAGMLPRPTDDSLPIAGEIFCDDILLLVFWCSSSSCRERGLALNPPPLLDGSGSNVLPRPAVDSVVQKQKRAHTHTPVPNFDSETETIFDSETETNLDGK